MLLLLLATLFVVDAAVQTIPLTADFTTKMTLGTPSKTYTLALDLAIGFPWVFLTNCTHPNDCKKSHNTYDPTASSTAKPTNIPFSYRYAGGTLSIDGYYEADVLGLGPAVISHFQTFAAVENANIFVFPDGTDGPLGLAYPMKDWANLSVIQNFYQAGVIDQPLFALWANQTAGQLHAGGYLKKAYTGNLGWAKVINNPFSPVSPTELFTWSNMIDDIKVNGSSTTYCRLTPCYFFIDPAAGGMDLGPAVPDVNLSSDCSNVNTLPTYTFMINGTGYDLYPSDYVIKTINQTTGAVQCTLGYATAAKPGSIVLGTTWLRAYYSIFDLGNAIMGFARAATSMG